MALLLIMMMERIAPAVKAAQMKQKCGKGPLCCCPLFKQEKMNYHAEVISEVNDEDDLNYKVIFYKRHGEDYFQLDENNCNSIGYG